MAGKNCPFFGALDATAVEGDNEPSVEKITARGRQVSVKPKPFITVFLSIASLKIKNKKKSEAVVNLDIIC